MHATLVQGAAAAATAVWAVSLRGVSVDTQLGAFVATGAMAAVALLVRSPPVLFAPKVATLSLTLAVYQTLLHASFSPAEGLRAQVVINLNFVFILLYDAATGTETVTAATLLGSAVIVVATLCVAAGAPPTPTPDLPPPQHIRAAPTPPAD